MLLGACFIMALIFGVGSVQAEAVLPNNFQTTHPLLLDFNIIDAKFNQNGLKILEFGGGHRSGFTGHDNLYWHGYTWHRFWECAAQFGLPMWYIRQPRDEQRKAFIATDTFLKHAGRFAENEHDLLAQISVQHQPVADGSFPDYKGIILINKTNKEYFPMYTFLKSKLPQATFVCETANHFVFDKYRTDVLFREPGLKQYRPKCMVCYKRYRKSLAKKIIGRMKCDMFVIKPLNAQYGKGIIFVTKEDLDSTLKTILVDKQTPQRILLSEALEWWSHDPNGRFIVEEYVPSTPVEVEGKLFDATLRVIFAMHLQDGQPHVTVFGAFWKLPTHAINDDVSLNQIHQSYQYDRAVMSAPLDDESLVRLQVLLQDALPKVYAKMINETNDQRVQGANVSLPGTGLHGSVVASI